MARWSGNLYYLHTPGKRIEGSQEVVDGVYMGGDYEQLRGVLTADARLTKHVRFFWAIPLGQGPTGQNQRKVVVDVNGNKKRIMDVRPPTCGVPRLRDGAPFAPLANFPDDPTN